MEGREGGGSTRLSESCLFTYTNYFTFFQRQNIDT